jgi:cytochrome c peroxidase
VVAACVATGLLALSLGCGGEAGSGDTADDRLPWAATAFPEPPGPAPAAASVELGKILFYDPILSVDRQTACGTCHSEFWGMSDALERSVGQGAGLLAGPGREGPHVVDRNSQGLWNLAFREDFFWDGRSATLEAQAMEPILAMDELGRDPAEIVADLDAIDEYRDLFAAAFPGDPVVSVEHLARALADFQRTMISNRSLYDGFARGDDAALSPDMREGMFRFADFGCDGCHAPPLFEAPGFERRNVPDVDGLTDEGRYEATGITDDLGRFRIPTLRNVAFTEPYFHNGSVAKLEDAIRHELEQSGFAYDDEDVRLIETFVRDALVDESREPQRPRTVPSGWEVPIDGTTVIR